MPKVALHAWDLVGVLPNLALREPIEAIFVALAPTSDERVRAIMDRSQGARTLLTGFVDSFNKPIEPTALIARADEYPTDLWTNEVMINFRNAVALAIILRARASASSGGWGAELSFSDYFDLHPTTVGNEGGLLTLTAAHGGYRSPASPFIGTSAPHLGRNMPELVPIDRSLLDPLLRA